MDNAEVKAVDLDDRCAEPDEDDVKVEKIEFNFAIPVYITPDQQRRMHDLVDEIASSPKNTPKEGVHWFSFNGARLSFSAIDSALLGQPVGDDPPENGEEPSMDETVLCFGTSARSFNSDRERERVKEERRPSAFTCPKCGGHSFGSHTLPDGYIRYCNGRGHIVKVELGKVVPLEGPDEPYVNCDFTWPEKDDRKYGLKPPA